MAGRAWEPFPRDTLVGGAGMTKTCLSEAIDVGEADGFAHEVRVEGAYPASVTFPVTVSFETAATLEFGNWVNLTPAGITPNVGSIATGQIANPLRSLRVRADVIQDEAVTVRVRILARPWGRSRRQFACDGGTRHGC